jgi:DNA polymerase II small subunit/DNA polymerase delta subunit B
MSEVTFDYLWESDKHEECGGEYERLLDMFENKYHKRPRIIEAGREAYDMMKAFVHADIHLTRGKRFAARQVRLHAEAA